MVQGYSKTDLSGVGFAPEQAELIALRVQSGVAALGSTLAGAATSVADIVHLGSVAANNNGFSIRDGNAYARRQVVINATAVVAKIFPPDAASRLNNQTPGTSMDLASGVAAVIDTIGPNLFWLRRGA